MSLINEALKKAQRQRAEPPPGADANDLSPTAVRRGRRPPTAQLLILGIAAAAVLIVFSVVITVHWLGDESAPPATKSPAPVVAAPNPSIDTAAPSPVIFAPVIPKPAASVEPSALASATPLSPAQDAPTPSASADSPAAASAPISRAANASAPLIPPISLAPGPDPRVQDFLDAIRVTGIRSSGNESKVLMNERVYRVNDVVDRTLQLKLIKVSADSLTFSDANGVTYTRNF